MKLIFRFLVTLVVMLSAYLFIFWVPLSYVPFHGVRWIPITFSLACALGIGWYVWAKSGSVPEELISSIVNGAVALGLIGFCAGFFGPIIFLPEANQGPLIGIFITGPLGFVLGAIGGAVHWKVKEKRGG